MDGWVLEEEEPSDYIFEASSQILQQNPYDEIKYELRSLSSTVGEMMKLLQEIKVTDPGYFNDESQIFFYKPTYICRDDYVRINRKNKLEMKVTLLGILKNEDVRLYILGIHKTYLTNKIKAVVNDSDHRVLVATFEPHLIEANCYCLKDKSYYEKLKFPLYFEISGNI